MRTNDNDMYSVANTDLYKVLEAAMENDPHCMIKVGQP